MISHLHFLVVAERLWSWLNCSDIPMAQFIINMNASMPQSQKFIIHILDNTHLFVQPNMAEMIRSAIAEFRDQISYEKPAWLHFFLFLFAVLCERCNGVENFVSSLIVSSTGQSAYFSVKRARLSNDMLRQWLILACKLDYDELLMLSCNYFRLLPFSIHCTLFSAFSTLLHVLAALSCKRLYSYGVMLFVTSYFFHFIYSNDHIFKQYWKIVSKVIPF